MKRKDIDIDKLRYAINEFSGDICFDLTGRIYECDPDPLIEQILSIVGVDKDEIARQVVPPIRASGKLSIR